MPTESPEKVLRCVSEFAFGDRTEAEDEQQAEEGHRDQFAKTAAGVFAVGVTVNVDVGLPAKKILELDDDKDGEQERDTAQHNRGLGEPQELSEHGFLLADQFLFLRLQSRMEEHARQQVRADENVRKSEDVFGQVINVQKIEKIREPRARRPRRRRRAGTRRWRRWAGRSAIRAPRATRNVWAGRRARRVPCGLPRQTSAA